MPELHQYIEDAWEEFASNEPHTVYQSSCNPFLVEIDGEKELHHGKLQFHAARRYNNTTTGFIPVNGVYSTITLLQFTPHGRTISPYIRIKRRSFWSAPRRFVPFEKSALFSQEYMVSSSLGLNINLIAQNEELTDFLNNHHVLVIKQKRNGTIFIKLQELQDETPKIKKLFNDCEHIIDLLNSLNFQGQQALE